MYANQLAMLVSKMVGAIVWYQSYLRGDLEFDFAREICGILAAQLSFLNIVRKKILQVAKFGLG